MRRGAPAAVQGVDRCHWVQSLRQALEAVLSDRRPARQAAALGPAVARIPADGLSPVVSGHRGRRRHPTPAGARSLRPSLSATRRGRPSPPWPGRDDAVAWAGVHGRLGGRQRGGAVVEHAGARALDVVGGGRLCGEQPGEAQRPGRLPARGGAKRAARGQAAARTLKSRAARPAPPGRRPWPVERRPVPAGGGRASRRCGVSWGWPHAGTEAAPTRGAVGARVAGVGRAVNAAGILLHHKRR
jgi:hypothetical protein